MLPLGNRQKRTVHGRVGLKIKEKHWIPEILGPGYRSKLSWWDWGVFLDVGGTWNALSKYGTFTASVNKISVNIRTLTVSVIEFLPNI